MRRPRILPSGRERRGVQLQIQPVTARPGRRLAEASVVPLISLAVWYALTRSILDPAILPGPDRVLDSFLEIIDLIPAATWVSLRMVLLGMAVGSVTGLATGIVFGYSSFIRRFFEATLDNLVRPVPLFALIPFFILWFGVGYAPQVSLVALAMFLLWTLVTLEAIRNVPHIYIQAALTTGASRFHIYRTVVVPAIFPHLVGSLRLAAASAWGLDAAVELIGGSRTGLGFILLVRNQYLDPAGMMMIVFVFCTMAIIFDQTVRFIAAKVTRWSPRTDRGLVGSMLGN
jgi:ABC-type nitrate/sulfonate/bicarbonate transport system permease component